MQGLLWSPPGISAREERESRPPSLASSPFRAACLSKDSGLAMPSGRGCVRLGGLCFSLLVKATFFS